MEINGCYRRKVNSKAFAIPILTAAGAVRIVYYTVLHAKCGNSVVSCLVSWKANRLYK